MLCSGIGPTRITATLKLLIKQRQAQYLLRGRRITDCGIPFFCQTIQAVLQLCELANQLCIGDTTVHAGMV